MPAITIESRPSLVYEQLMQAATLHRRCTSKRHY
jgi:hypothetical protein